MCVCVCVCVWCKKAWGGGGGGGGESGGLRHIAGVVVDHMDVSTTQAVFSEQKRTEVRRRSGLVGRGPGAPAVVCVILCVHSTVFDWEALA